MMKIITYLKGYGSFRYNIEDGEIIEIQDGQYTIEVNRGIKLENQKNPFKGYLYLLVNCTIIEKIEKIEEKPPMDFSESNLPKDFPKINDV